MQSWSSLNTPLEGSSLSSLICLPIVLFIPFIHHQSDYPASRGYIFAVWAGVRKVASADNRSIFYRACAKFVTRFASNWFVKSAWVSRENYLRTTLLELLFCFSASPLLVLTILAAKFPRIVFFRKVFLCYQL